MFTIIGLCPTIMCHHTMHPSIPSLYVHYSRTCLRYASSLLHRASPHFSPHVYLTLPYLSHHCRPEDAVFASIAISKGSEFVSTFQHVVVYLPYEIQGCGWGGLAEVQCLQNAVLGRQAMCACACVYVCVCMCVCVCGVCVFHSCIGSRLHV
jgi:hypothetical protein